MRITLVNYTEFPIWTIGNAAGVCYGKRVAPAIEDERVRKRVKACFEGKHMSVFEHANVTFEADGISRACSHQLVRHRLASYSQQSQRYCKIDVDNDGWYVIPPDILEYNDPDGVKDLLQYYRHDMSRAGYAYLTALGEGIKPEDARYLLPEATKTDIVVTMNCREIFHFLDLRLSKRSQWEIRKLAEGLVDVLRTISCEWADLMDLYEGKW